MFISLGYFVGCSHCELLDFLLYHRLLDFLQYCDRGAQIVGQGFLQEKIDRFIDKSNQCYWDLRGFWNHSWDQALCKHKESNGSLSFLLHSVNVN